MGLFDALNAVRDLFLHVRKITAHERATVMTPAERESLAARAGQDAGRFGPPTLAAQFVGGACAVCTRKIVSVLGASVCPVCEQPCHDDCQSEHVHEPNPAGGYR